jgi:hypothetical protein
MKQKSIKISAADLLKKPKPPHTPPPTPNSAEAEMYEKAKLGDSNAQFVVGYYYFRKGDSANPLNENWLEAERWFTKAAEQGDKSAKHRLKTIEMERQKYLKKFAHLIGTRCSDPGCDYCSRYNWNPPQKSFP